MVYTAYQLTAQSINMLKRTKILPYFLTGILLWLSLSLAGSGLLLAQVNNSKPDAVEEVSIEEKLGDFIPSDITLKDSKGNSVTMDDLLRGDKPVIINPVYYECPMLCGLVLNGLLEGMKELAWSPGKDYNVLTLSIDPNEGVDLASQNKKNYVKNLGKNGASDGWFFLTGDSTNIRRLTKAIGFNFTYVPEKDQYAHAAGIALASPSGKITRYLYGIDFKEIDLKNALYEAANGNIGNTLDKLVMYCYQYNPNSNSYAPVAINVMKIGGLATFLFLGIFLSFFWYNEKIRKVERSA